MAIKLINKTSSNGVNRFPIISTTFDGAMVNNQVTAKKAIEVQRGSALGNDGNIPTSKVVAAVLGMAINGPIQSMMMVPRIGERNLLILVPRSSNDSPEFTTESIPKKGNNIPVRPNARMVIQTWSPICIPI